MGALGRDGPGKGDLKVRPPCIIDLIAFAQSRDADPDFLFWLRHCGALVSIGGVRHAWGECPRSDWLLWLATELGISNVLVMPARAAADRTLLEGAARPRGPNVDGRAAVWTPQLDAAAEVRVAISGERIVDALKQALQPATTRATA